MNSQFIIVGTKDNPLFNANFIKNADLNKDPTLNEFIIYAALDQVDELLRTQSSANFKVVDRHGDWYVSAFITNSSYKFMLLHDVKNDEAVKSFFLEAFEAFCKVLMNPFYEFDTKIKNKAFGAKIEQLAKRFL